MGNLHNRKYLVILLLVVAVVGISAITVIKIRRRPPATVSEVLKKMRQAQRVGRYSEAIAFGDRWTRDFPLDGSNDQIFGQIAFNYLAMAQQDSRNKEENVHKALEFRNKMLPVLSDSQLGWYSAVALEDAVSITETAADISEPERCVQFGNSLKLLDREINLLHEKQAALSNQAEDKFGYKPSDVRRLLERADESIARIKGKQLVAHCQ